VRMLAQPDIFTKDSADHCSIPEFLAGVCRSLDTKAVKSASVIVDAHIGISECGSANTVGKHVAGGGLSELPLPLRFPTIPPETSKVDIIIQNMGDGCWNVLKVIYLERSISSTAALSMCSGKPFVPVFRPGPHAVKKAIQWALARVRGHHVHWHRLEDKSSDTLLKSSSNLWSPENDELAEGIRYINSFAPDCNEFPLTTASLNVAFAENILPLVYPLLLSAAIIMVGNPGVGKTPAIITMAMAIGRYHVRRLGLHGVKPGWRRGKSLDNFRQRSPQIQEALFLDDPSGRRLDMADLKSFVTTDEDGTVSGRYNDARLTRNQFRALASNDTGDGDIHKDMLAEKDKHLYNTYKNGDLRLSLYIGTGPKANRVDRASFVIPETLVPENEPDEEVLAMAMGKQITKKKPSYLFPFAKKGKTRFLLKDNLTKTPTSNKVQSEKWRKTPYVKNPIKIRVDRLKWKRNLKDFIGVDEDATVKLLTEDGLLPDWPSVQGTVDSTIPLQTQSLPEVHPSATPQNLHPIFTSNMGSEGHPLAIQASALLLRLAGIPLSSIHIVLGINHKALESMEKKLATTRKCFVDAEQARMVLGNGKSTKWTEVEADEAVFDKCLIAAEDAHNPNKTMKWEQWLGMVPRGKPSSLVLFRLRSLTTHKRAPGKKVWKPPTFVRLAKHKLPNGRKITVKAGTQVIDRAWRFLKERVKINQNTKTGSHQLTAKIRAAQYEYWQRGKDMWASTGTLLTWYMDNITSRHKEA
ncbi:unnamed protein product, partial [Symbiodinium necroappetens]